MTAIPIKDAARLAGAPRTLVYDLIARGLVFSDRGRVSEACIPLLKERAAERRRAQGTAEARR